MNNNREINKFNIDVDKAVNLILFVFITVGLSQMVVYIINIPPKGINNKSKSNIV